MNIPKLTIRPAAMKDKRRVYDWLAHSNLTIEMLGPPNFPDAPIPTWQEFIQDYSDHYFDGSKPWKGRCFILSHNGEDIGNINYNEIDAKSKTAEIDIWLADRKFTRQGYGRSAIKWISQFLAREFGCMTIYIAPSKRNIKAIKAYKKAGFCQTEKRPHNFIPDYYDAIVLKRDSIQPIQNSTIKLKSEDHKI